MLNTLEKPAELQTDSQSLLVDIPQVCKLLNISRSVFYRLNQSGKFGLLPVGLCSKILYRRDELKDWIKAECPARQIWQQIKKSRNKHNG